MVGSAWERESGRWGWGSEVREEARGSMGRREGVKEGWMETRESRKKRMSGNGGGREREEREREERERELQTKHTTPAHHTLPPFLPPSLPPCLPPPSLALSPSLTNLGKFCIESALLVGSLLEGSLGRIHHASPVWHTD